LLIGLAVLVPGALIAALIAVAVRFGRRRRREAALDPA
jgi:threonine/homoserine/homoserine lactone efflux protein